jgi:hypothetical protein
LSRCRTRAAASATARLFPAGPRNLRHLRRSAAVGRGDLRVRRLGHVFGANRYGYQPDIITTAKGLTSATRRWVLCWRATG